MLGLAVGVPAVPALDSADKPDTANAPAAIPAATYFAEGTSRVLPLLTVEVIQASCFPPSPLSCNVAWLSKSGTLKAMAGILLMYESGMVCSPLAPKVPWGTRYSQQALFSILCSKDVEHTRTKLGNFVVFVARVEFFLVHFDAVGLDDKRSHDLLLFLAGTRDVEDNLLGGLVELNVHAVDLDVGIVLAGLVASCFEYVASQSAKGSRGKQYERSEHAGVGDVCSHGVDVFARRRSSPCVTSRWRSVRANGEERCGMK